jgi:Tfp pilus assembly protein PilO
MSRSFNFHLSGIRGPGARLRVLAIVLAVLNVAAIYFYIAPPGGSRRDLHDQEAQIRSDIDLHQLAAQRLKTVSQKVELGGEQTEQFGSQYFLPRRTAFSTIMAELLRISSAAGINERQRSYSEEPIEGTDDLTLLTINSTYQGTYADLMHLVNEVDHSSLLLILDSLSAAPQQEGVGMLNVQMRFLTIIHEDGSAVPGSASAGGQP